MMKLISSFLVSLFSFVVVNEAAACSYTTCPPHEYYMYRVHQGTIDKLWDTEDLNPGSTQNGKEWQELTSRSIPVGDIYHVVYKMTLEEFEMVYNNRTVEYKNKFAEWITKKDTAILDYLLLAKTNEYIRLKRNSRWYYPSMKIGARMTIEKIAEKALAADDKRLRDRYLLQAIRALFSMAKYEKCVELWEKEACKLPDNSIMRQMMFQYIVGAKFHLGHTEEALHYYANVGDVASLYACLDRKVEDASPIDALELVCQYAPNSPYITEALQTYVRKQEIYSIYYRRSNWIQDPQVQRFLNLCLKMARSGKSNNPAMWYYTAAFMADFCGDVGKSANFLELAEQSKSSSFIDESIKVFRMYLDAKMLPYNSDYEERLFGQLKWLDAKIANNIDNRVKEETANIYKPIMNISYYYWNDMMRKILLGTICPRMIEAGMYTRALQLSNMAENRLYGLINQINIHDWIETPDGYKEQVKKYTMDKYRYSDKENELDYRNHFFEMIDSLGVGVAESYLRNVQMPKSDFDRFLNRRGYTNLDYLNDIVGTQYLRNTNYDKALKFLGKVSTRYKYHHNVYLQYDPFEVDQTKTELKSDFKLDFSREMCSLKENIESVTDPNRKALLMIKYAIGMRNSFDWCWGLTQYYKGEVFWSQVCKKRDWENERLTLAAKHRAKHLIEDALGIMTDDELAAECHFKLRRLKTLVREYPDTQYGMYVKGKCDNLYDYYK